MVPLSTVCPSPQRGPHPARHSGGVQCCGHRPLFLRQPIMSIHSDRAPNCLHECTWACGHIRQEHSAHRKEADTLPTLRAVGHQHAIQLTMQVCCGIKRCKLFHRCHSEKRLRTDLRHGKAPQVLDKRIHTGAPGHQDHGLGGLCSDITGHGLKLRCATLHVVQDSGFAAMLAIMHRTKVDAKIAISLQAPSRQACRPFLVISLQRFLHQLHLPDKLTTQRRCEHCVRDAPRQRLWE
mmetsp:Transcript_73434/g.185174  ORF Transcript_73434/g.185174 Transcript_73434/m.185174 type:complete len:237 (-) Transcript_73434:1718-2428(-)